MFWPKNSPHGFLKDKNSSELLYLLVSKATIPADKTVLPEDDDILKAAEEAEKCVAKGTGMVLEHIDTLKSVLLTPRKLRM